MLVTVTKLKKIGHKSVYKVLTGKSFKIRRKLLDFNRFFISLGLLNLVWCQLLMAQIIDESTISYNNYTTIKPEIDTSENDTVKVREGVNLVTNLTVVPFLASESSKDLQLNISWHPSEDDKMLDFYIVVKPTKGCPPAPCLIFIPNSSHHWRLVPSLTSTVVGTECTIKPGCTYNISLKSRPFTGKIFTTEITIPECYKHICHCENPYPLPRPIVNVKILNNNTANISWTVPNITAIPENIKVSYFKISFGEQPIINNLKFFNRDKVLKQVYKDTVTHWKEINVPDATNGTYHVKVSLIDAKGCSGLAGKRNFTFLRYNSIETIEQFTDKYIIILSLALASCLLLLAVVIARRMLGKESTPCCIKSLLVRARADPNLRRQQVWPPATRFVCESNGQIALGSNRRRLQERCPLYIEQEIEEARSRGEVDEYEISSARLQFGSVIGEGAFGQVFIARLDVLGYPIVAVKRLKEKASPEETKDLLSEISMLKVVGKHEHVIALVGCCTLKQPFCIVMEYAERGDLEKHLKSLRDRYYHLSSFRYSATSSLTQPLRLQTGKLPSVAETEYTTLESEGSKYVPNSLSDTRRMDMVSSYTGASIDSDTFGTSSTILLDDLSQTVRSPERVLDPKELHSYALQIAKGMEHLENKGITHRDLAARNVLIDGSGKLKISDLGLSRPKEYITKNKNKVPLRWMAPEAICSSQYSSKSDVWSFAVVLWEIGTLGAFPYNKVNDSHLTTYLHNGGRLDKPTIVSDELYSTMQRCWSEGPEKRPSFSELVHLLDADESRNKAYVDVAMLEKIVSFPPTQENVALNRLQSEESNEEAKRLWEFH